VAQLYMPSVAPLGEIEKRLWESADQLRANSKLKASEYSVPVLGLIFLRFADAKFEAVDQQIKAEAATSTRRAITKADYQARGVVYLPEAARFSYLLQLPESADIGGALDKDVLISLLKIFSRIPVDIEGDAFGKIYEYFLGKFAMAEGQQIGEFINSLDFVQQEQGADALQLARVSLCQCLLAPGDQILDRPVGQLYSSAHGMPPVRWSGLTSSSRIQHPKSFRNRSAI
jgi:type I restriction-modification system DNA methylase subunit